jgi:phage terminase large subunit GpA-like protein
MSLLLTKQSKQLRKAVRLGLTALYRPEPLTASEWADKNFYLSSESSYHEGRWETLHFQVAILNSFGSDNTRTVNVIKSARLGYTKMLLAAIAYYIEHKRRNVLTFSPTDTDAENFSKSHVDTAIRDVPPLRELAPWVGMKHRDNTMSVKVFANRKSLYIHGGKAARNYREKSVDVVVYDELAAFDPDIEKEGNPTTLGDKRLEGSTFGKSIRGSTPKIRGECQIESAASESPYYFRYKIPCPHCGAEQSLKWGGPECDFGIKWDADEGPTSAFYLCEAGGCVIKQHEINDRTRKFSAWAGRWVCDLTGAYTRDGLEYFTPDDLPLAPPGNITFHVWTAYSPFTTWARIVEDFIKAKGDARKLKTFVNTTLGETWEDEAGERLEWEQLYNRREIFPEVPTQAVGLFGGIDTQDDRYEGRVWAYGPGEESWLVDKWILYGDPGGEELKKKVFEKIRKQYVRDDGLPMGVTRWGWDSGGHYTDEVYSASKQLGIYWVIPVKGASTYGKPVANFPRKRNASGVYLTLVGTDNAKEIIYSRLRIQPEPGESVPGCIHLPANNEICDDEELKQLTAEVKRAKISNGRRVYLWDAKGRRNESLDCKVYALAALRISQQRFGFSLDTPPPEVPEKPKETPAETPVARSHSGGNWLNVDSGKGWI